MDPDSIWLDLCLNRDLAKDRSRAFLRRFVKDSVTRVPTLRPEEYELKRTINSANTLLNVWRSLIAQADATVLLDKKAERPFERGHLEVEIYGSHQSSAPNGPCNPGRYLSAGPGRPSISTFPIRKERRWGRKQIEFGYTKQYSSSRVIFASTTPLTGVARHPSRLRCHSS